MPFNLLKTYNQLLEVAHLSEMERRKSLQGIFKRDIEDNPNFSFRSKKVNPVKGEPIPMQTLFTHLTTVITDEATRKREFELQRSLRLHWVKHHIDEKKKEGMLVFSSNDGVGIRTYILDVQEKYVIVLAPYRNEQEYYLLTAYYLEGRNFEKLKNKYKRRLPETL
jgi:hypothetical protein